jgi:hypothetical protein
MKRIVTFFLLLLITVKVSAQTEKETIKWLEKVMNDYGKVEGLITDKAPEVSVTSCEIIVDYYINYTEHYQLTIPTSNLIIKESGRISAGTYRIKKERIDRSESSQYSFYSTGYVIELGEPNLYVEVKKAFDRLASFCPEKTSSTAVTGDCNCAKPAWGQFFSLGILVENQDYYYKAHLQKISCVDRELDSDAVIREKVNYTWETNYAELGYVGEGFIHEGNILKYSVNQEFELFVDGMVGDFGININLKDPSDNKTLLDFTLDEINRYKKYPEYQDKAKDLEAIYTHFKADLNAKHAAELTPQDALPYSVKKVKISVPVDLLKAFEGKYSAENYNPVYIKIENDKLLYSFGENANFFELSADSKTSFFRKPTPAFANSEFTFKQNTLTGKYDLILNQNSKNLLFKKTE